MILVVVAVVVAAAVTGATTADGGGGGGGAAAVGVDSAMTVISVRGHTKYAYATLPLVPRARDGSCALARHQRPQPSHPRDITLLSRGSPSLRAQAPVPLLVLPHVQRNATRACCYRRKERRRLIRRATSKRSGKDPK